MTQEELYWYEKRLYMQADAKEREIRDQLNLRIRHLGDFGMPEEKQRRERMRIEGEALRIIEFARLEILEPVLDTQKKARLRQLRLQKQIEEARQRTEAEWQRKAYEEKKNRERLEDARRKRQEEKEKRIRAIEAAAKAERERIEREKQERIENTKTAIGWIVGILVIGGIITAIIIFRKWIIAGILVVFGLSILLSD